MKPSPRTLLRLAVSLALLGLVLSRARLTGVMNALSGVSLVNLAAAFALLAVGTLVAVLRWRLLISVHAAAPSLGRLARISLYGVFLNNFLPTTVGGDTFRAYEVSRGGTPLATSIVTVLTERFIGLTALFLMAALFFPLISERFGFTVPWLPIALAAVGSVLLVWRATTSTAWIARLSSLTRRLPWGHGILRLLEKVGAPLAGFFSAPLPLAGALILSFLLQASMVLLQFSLAKALGFSVPLWVFFGVIPVTRLIISLPVTVNGIGLREGSLAFFLGAWGVSSAQAVAMAWLEYGMVLVEGLVGWLCYAGSEFPPGTSRDSMNPTRDSAQSSTAGDRRGKSTRE